MNWVDRLDSMDNIESYKSLSPDDQPYISEEKRELDMPVVLHTLSNKLLPIMAFSDLGSRRCDDPQFREYFEKIRQAAADSREFIIQLRQQIHQIQKDSSEPSRLLRDSGPVT